MSTILKFPRRYTYIIVGMENGVWTERPHHGPIETIPAGMSWKARRVDGPTGGMTLQTMLRAGGSYVSSLGLSTQPGTSMT